MLDLDRALKQRDFLIDQYRRGASPEERNALAVYLVQGTEKERVPVKITQAQTKVLGLLDLPSG